MSRAMGLFLAGLVMATATTAVAAPNVMHPAFPVLDAAGASVLQSGLEPSSEKTCGACHDTVWIDAHNAHVSDRVRATCVDCHLEGSRLPTEPAAFEADGKLRRDALLISEPRPANCARCHGLVHEGSEPLALPDDYETAPTVEAPWRTYDLTRTTGEIVSGQDQSESFLNLANKETLSQPWDVHARRGVGCTSCHFAPNNPARAPTRDSGLAVLATDPRRLSTSDYLRRPDHRMAAASCTACHDPMKAHDFLPYRKRHLAVLACQACHVPRLLGPALMDEDATVVTRAGGPAVEYRGVREPRSGRLNAELLGGYAPFLLAPTDLSKGPRLAPFNLVTRWQWVSLATDVPVPFETVRRAWIDGDHVVAPLVSLLDTDGDGVVADTERVLDTGEKVEAVRARLTDLGVVEPAIRAHVRAYAVNHGVVAGADVRRDCEDCHGAGGRLEQPLVLSSKVRGDVLPLLDPDKSAMIGSAALDASQRVVLRRDEQASRFYVFGVSSVAWPARVGFGLFTAVMAGILLHAGLRLRARRRNPAAHGAAERVYMYTAYERFWHWVMALSVLVLLVTGFEVHGRGDLDLFGIPLAVRLHDVFALVLLANAFLSLFYHVASSAIRQFLPARDNLPGAMAAQARYYFRGIFLGQPHPVPKSLDSKLNPLQQVTYLGLLNLLFPFQVITGVLMWGVSEWPDLAASLGGLTIVAPLHHVGAWLFLTFLVLHVYLTTTGRTVFSNLSAMIDGWEEVDELEPTPQGGSHDR